jgi:acetyl esterase/lipase
VRRTGAPRRRRASVAAVVLLALVAGCSGGAPEFDPKLYDLSRKVDLNEGDRGRLIDWQRAGGAPDGIRAYRFLYQSEGAQGEPIAVTALAYRPDAGPSGDCYPVIVYAHGTTGVADACAPSWHPSNVALIKNFVDAGYAVVQTDYQGLGTPGAHPYLNGPSEGRTLLDSLQAARQIEPLGLDQKRAAIWGYSQGGHAALAASQMADDMHRLGIVGVVDAAGPSRGSWLTDQLQPGAGNGYLFPLLAEVSWAQVFGLDLSQVAGPAVVADAPTILDEHAKTCPDAEKLAVAVPQSQRVVRPMSDLPGWRDALGAADIPLAPAAAPVFIQHGTSDKTVAFGESVHAKQLLCLTGTAVAVNVQDRGTHLTAVDPKPGLAWLKDRFAGAPPPSSC